MSLGEVDTLNLLTEKLENLFNESQGYYESFLDTNNLYKAGKISDKEFFAKLGDYTVAYSALEFLAIKVILEIKKSLDKVAGGQAPGGTHSPGLMPGMGGAAAGMAGAGMAGGPPPRMGTAASPVGAPPSIVSAGQGFSQPGTLPSPDPMLVQQAPPQAPPQQQPAAAAAGSPACASCGAALRPNAKFCTKCGERVL